MWSNCLGIYFFAASRNLNTRNMFNQIKQVKSQKRKRMILLWQKLIILSITIVSLVSWGWLASQEKSLLLLGLVAIGELRDTLSTSYLLNTKELFLAMLLDLWVQNQMQSLIQSTKRCVPEQLLMLKFSTSDLTAELFHLKNWQNTSLPFMTPLLSTNRGTTKELNTLAVYSTTQKPKRKLQRWWLNKYRILFRIKESRHSQDLK